MQIFKKKKSAAAEWSTRRPLES